ncbi:MAG: ABC transporter substrate-binding protein [Sarcina sp.]
MKRNKIKLLGLAAVLAMSCTFMACGGGNKSVDGAKPSVEQKKNTLVYGSGDYTTINPVTNDSSELDTVLFAGLVARDGDANIIPNIAESWKLDEANMTYTFKLRNDVKFHDGKQLTAHDVKFTFDEIMNPDNMAARASAFEEVKSVDVVSDTELKLVLKEPNAAILDALTVGVVPKHLLEGKDIKTADFNTKPIGAGPYKLESWDKGQNIVMVKNDDYFEGAPSIEKIIFKIVTDDKALAMQIKSGELDLAQVTPKDMKVIEKQENLDVYKMVTADYRGIMYDFNSPLFKNNKGLINALNYAVDRQAILDSVLLGYGKVAYSPLQMGDYNNPDMEKFDYNPKKAQEELEKLGFKKGSDGVYEKNGEKLTFEIVCGEGDQVRIDMATICAQSFNEIGVAAKVAVKAKVDWGNEDCYLVGWGSPFDPDDHTYRVFGTGLSTNYNNYSNSKIDEILKKARQTYDNDERLKYYKEFQEELAKDMPYTFINYLEAMYVANDNLKGIDKDVVLGHHGAGIFFNVDEWSLEAE